MNEDTTKEPPCLICGRVENKPMCYRGEPWCCNRHRQEVERGRRATRLRRLAADSEPDYGG